MTPEETAELVERMVAQAPAWNDEQRERLRWLLDPNNIVDRPIELLGHDGDAAATAAPRPCIATPPAAKHVGSRHARR